jgi:DNA mismatch repair protein MutH
VITIKAPESEQELLERAGLLAGKTIGRVATELDMTAPLDQSRNKGWTGRLAELYLGATASTLAEPDFLLIGVELKTVPINNQGRPAESTYVCTVALSSSTGTSWETSVVRKKLARVLWLPIESDKSIPYGQRRFGSALLWSPEPEQEAVLKNDWEEIMELIVTGSLDKVSSRQGRYLQIRPKAANAATLGRSWSSEGLSSSTLPRGFYLRSSFTWTIFDQARKSLYAADPVED